MSNPAKPTIQSVHKLARQIHLQKIARLAAKTAPITAKAAGAAQAAAQNSTSDPSSGGFFLDLAENVITYICDVKKPVPPANYKPRLLSKVPNKTAAVMAEFQRRVPGAMKPKVKEPYKALKRFCFEEYLKDEKSMKALNAYLECVGKLVKDLDEAGGIAKVLEAQEGSKTVQAFVKSHVSFQDLGNLGKDILPGFNLENYLRQRSETKFSSYMFKKAKTTKNLLPTKTVVTGGFLEGLGDAAEGFSNFGSGLDTAVFVVVGCVSVAATGFLAYKVYKYFKNRSRK